MPDVDDITLLREYADGNSESAFAAIVQRHINLVYSVALRYVGNSPDAQDVTQAVFIILAQKAASLRQRTTLTGWLYETTRFTAMNFLTGKTRRQAREQKAYMESMLSDANSEDVWRQLAPLLEEAMGRLSEKERTLVALRFFENRSAAETAAVLGIQEWAAHKRAARAMEKLRRFFVKRGIVSTTATLAGAISANSVQAAPAMLAKATATSAFAKGVTASASTLTLVKGALKIMAWTKAKTAIIAGIGVLLAAGTAKVVITEIAAHRTPIWQEKYDLSVLDLVAPQTKILFPPPSRTANVNLAGMKNGKRVGWGKDFPEILMAAYGWKFNAGQLIFSVPVPLGRYDFISNLPKNQSEAMQQEIKKQFGLIGRREMIETNVLILNVRSTNATGLSRTSGGNTTFAEGADSLVMHNQSIFSFVDFLRRNLGILVMNRTRFSDNLDIDLKWDGTPEGLKQATLNQLGLELVPAKESVEFLVVEKAN